MAKISLKSMTRSMPAESASETLNDMLQVESDRGACILGTSTVEHALGIFIRKHMIELNADDENNIFQNNGALSTFSGKINIAFAFGLFDIAMINELRVMKELRNIFAHSPTTLNFEHPTLAEQCEKLVSLAAMQKIPETPREKFVRAAQTVFIILRFRGSGTALPPRFDMPDIPQCKPVRPRTADRV